MNGEDRQKAAVGLQAGLGAQAAQREASIKGVRDDAFVIQERLGELENTVMQLQDHLMGESNLKPRGASETADEPEVAGMLPLLCNLGSKNITHIVRIQEQLNQICHQLGIDR